MAYGNRSKVVEVSGLIFLNETEKAFLVAPLKAIEQHIEPIAVTDYSQIKETVNQLGIWIPKSQIMESDIIPTDVFPHLHMKYPCKYNPEYTAYKFEIHIKIPQWLAQKNNLEYDDTGETATPEDVTPSGGDVW